MTGLLLRDLQVGYLVRGEVVICKDCHAQEEALHPNQLPRPVPLYRVNILPYRQDCGVCGKVLCEGQSPSWPVLFKRESGVQKVADRGACLYCHGTGFHGDEFTGGESYCMCSAGQELHLREASR